MSDPQDVVIRPQEAPLSHLASEQRTNPLRAYLDWRVLALVALVGAAILFAVYWRPDVQAPARAPGSGGTADATSEEGDVVAADNELAPFAQAQRKRAREEAQAALSLFVERQIQLEQGMQVDAWGASELERAMTEAKSGDEEFLRENFDAALASYEAAAAAMGDVIARGDALFEERLVDGIGHIDERRPAAAAASIASALEIKPDDPGAQAVQQRVAKLPQVITLLRTARNHELGGRYDDALASYDEVLAVDPLTVGIEALRAQARSGQAGDDLTANISQGFAALERNDFDGARSAFNRALKIDPNNDVALGGLAQVADKYDLNVIERHRKAALEAMANERWQPAIDAYEAVLELDGNIQFAVSGLRDAKNHQRAQNLLARIAGAPEKLSNEKLYLDAVDILERSRALTRRGPTLDKLVDEVGDLLTLYRDPVDVVLLSDNATDVIVSNVGRLGFFERKTLSLRPGQYTIRGSQAGCRDIYMSVDVIPGIDPLSVACEETIQR